MKKFKKIYIEITNICNLSCSFCSKVEKPRKMVTVSEFKTIVEKTYVKKEDIGSSITNVDGYTIMLTKEAIITTCDKNGNMIE